MQFSSPSEYLKQLKIQKYYVNKFKINYANHNILTNYCDIYIRELDKEINKVELNIAKYKLKKKFQSKEYKGQVSIYDFDMEDK